MNITRIRRIEDLLRPVAGCFTIDDEGWILIGGGKYAAGVIRIPRVLSATEWILAGNTESEAAQGRS